MNAKYWQRGETLDYTPASAVENGAVVNLTTRIGIAGSDIAAGETGQVHVSGVFLMDKAAVDIALGAAVYYDAENDVITTTATSNTPAGYAAAAAAEAATTVLVKLLG
jgi:predicted RecA/RadA family phage recombinase